MKSCFLRGISDFLRELYLQISSFFTATFFSGREPQFYRNKGQIPENATLIDPALHLPNNSVFPLLFVYN